MITLGLSKDRTIRAAGEPWAPELRPLQAVTWPAPYTLAVPTVDPAGGFGQIVYKRTRIEGGIVYYG